jgi:hypothetical protein
MKSIHSAKQAIEILPGGRVRASIQHDTMHGVTPEMVRWWFEHIDERTHFNGRDFSGPAVPAYRMWHPFDHIDVSWVRRVYDRSGRLAPGSVIRIEENIGARYPVRAKARVTKFDDGAFNFSPLLGGLIPVGTLIHEYAETERGCSFYTEMLIGTTLPLIGPFVNSLIRRFVASEDFLQAWIVHNIEESGETEQFVPRLFEHARGSRGAA